MKKTYFSVPVKNINVLFRRFFFLLFTLFFCINSLCLFIAIVSPFINPKYFWLPALFGLFFKIFFLANCIFIIGYFLYRSKRGIVACLLAFTISIPSLAANFGFHFREDKYEQNDALRLMTYNCTSFGWFKNPDYEGVVSNIRNANPDILCLQEYYKHTKKHKKLLQFLSNEMGFKYYYEYTTRVLKSKNQVGQAYFSKIPLHNFSPIVFSNNTSNGASYVDIYLKNDTVRLINVHFQSIRLHEKEYDITNLKPLEPSEGGKSNQLIISLEKIRNAFRRRSYQTMQVDSVIKNSPYKVIVCGDFNDTPNSYLYKTLTNSLDDSYLKTNFGIGSSFAGKIPGLRIDYILTDPDIKVAKTFVWRHVGGQHYPLVSDILLDNK